MDRNHIRCKLKVHILYECKTQFEKHTLYSYIHIIAFTVVFMRIDKHIPNYYIVRIRPRSNNTIFFTMVLQTCRS